MLSVEDNLQHQMIYSIGRLAFHHQDERSHDKFYRAVSVMLK